MKTERYSDRRKKQKILRIKEELEKEGFKTTWRNPFFAWVHDIPLDKWESESKISDTLYICDPPVPKIVPFDFAAVRLNIHPVHIYFELSLYYCKELKDVVDADAINEILTRHAADLAPKMAVYFNDIAMEFSLQWDTEYDEYIEDSLYGNFPVESSDQIIALMQAIQNRWLEWKRDRE